jgi:diguanylate cyclase (GGDEF)-like protein
LTDLFNRRCFFRTAEEKLARAILCGPPISITLIDLDHFKRVNDTHGHLVGDRVLVHVAQLIRAHCRMYDVAARYGGEEFVILHSAVDSQDAFRVAEGIRKTVELTPFSHETEKIGVTLSAGVVDTKGRMGCSRIDDVLALADIALYQAKDAGRNQVIVFEN